MTETEAVKKALVLSGFVFGGQTFFYEDTVKACYVPVHVVYSFEVAIDYMQSYAFHRHCNKEEKKIYYRTARKLEKFREKFHNRTEF